MTSANITTVPVQHVRILRTDSGPVGYLLYNTFGVQTGEGQLVDAFNEFRNAGVNDVILDLRYNGGGYLILANQLSYMVGGANAAGRTFNLLQFNDKHRETNPFTGESIEPDRFYQWTIGWSDAPAGTPLPRLNLDRLFILAGPRTCSASETGHQRIARHRRRSRPDRRDDLRQTLRLLSPRQLRNDLLHRFTSAASTPRTSATTRTASRRPM